MPALLHFRGWGEGTKWSTRDSTSSLKHREENLGTDHYIDPKLESREEKGGVNDEPNIVPVRRCSRWISPSSKIFYYHENKHNYQVDESQIADSKSKKSQHIKFSPRSSVKTRNANTDQSYHEDIIRPKSALLHFDQFRLQEVNIIDDERGTSPHPYEPDSQVTPANSLCCSTARIEVNEINLSLLPSRSCLKNVLLTRIEDENNSACDRCDKKTVSFSPKLKSTRYYNRIVGDHPQCKDGPPLSLGWDYYTDNEASNDEREEVETRGKCKPLTTEKRWEKLTGELGFYTESELKREIRHMRKSSCNRLSLSELFVLESEVKDTKREEEPS